MRQPVVLVKIGYHPKDAFVAGHMHSVGVTHVAGRSGMQVKQMGKHVVIGLLLRYIALVLMVGRECYFAGFCHGFVGEAMEQQSQYHE